MTIRECVAAFLVLIGVVLGGCASRCETCCGEPVAARDALSRDMSILGNDQSSLVRAVNMEDQSWRVIALVSPTCSECVYGAEAVKKEIADRYQPQQVAAMIVWIPMISTDNEEAAHASATIFPVDRVTHFFDA